MPTGRQIVKRLAELGLDGASALDQSTRELRSAALAPASTQAAGVVESVHWPSRSYARLIISRAAPTSLTTVETVRLLGALPHARSEAGSDGPFGQRERSDPQDMNLEDYFAAVIEHAAEMDAGTLAAEKVDTEFGTITMRLDPPRVEVRLPYGAGQAYTLVFEEPPPSRDPRWNLLYDPRYAPKPGLWARRTTELPYAALLACAELLAMTPGHKRSPGGSSDEGDPQPRTPNENAPDPARSEALREGETGGKTDYTAPETLPSSENREAGKIPQPLCGLVDRPSRAQSSARLKSHEVQAA